MFPGLQPHRLERNGVGLAVWSGGQGPSVVLLHGYPQNSLMWRGLVPDLLRDHRVVLMDLRGYGQSDAPAAAEGDGTYSKREMALDVTAVLEDLQVQQAHLVGHDRGGRVVHRLCLDHPSVVASAAVLDIVPTLHMYDHVDRTMAEAYFHWFFLTRSGGLPEALIEADPRAWIRSRFVDRHGADYTFDEDVLTSYEEAFRRPGVIAATCADYRAAATIDLDHDRRDREAGRVVERPLLVGWGTQSYVGSSFDVPEVWRPYADRVTPAAIESNHYVAEENPAATLDALRTFWGQQ